MASHQSSTMWPKAGWLRRGRAFPSGLSSSSQSCEPPSVWDWIWWSEIFLLKVSLSCNWRPLVTRSWPGHTSFHPAFHKVPHFFIKYQSKHWTTFPTRTRCGYATVKNVRDHSLADRMESFFLAETTKYLYLLFDPNNFLHNKVSSKNMTTWTWIINFAYKVSILFHQLGMTQGNTAEVVKVEGQGRCMLDAGGYIFNTEAHPIDPAALACCSGLSEDEVISATQLSWPSYYIRALPG